MLVALLLVKTMADQKAEYKKGLLNDCEMISNGDQLDDSVLLELSLNYKAVTVADVQTIECVMSEEGKSHGKATAICIQCWDKLCDTCAQAHTGTRITRDHAIKAISDLTKEDIQQHQKQAAGTCLRHSGQQIVTYCSDCHETACAVCCLSRHAQHKITDLEQVNETFFLMLTKMIAKYKDQEKEIQAEVDKLSDIRNKLEAYQEKMITQVRSNLNELKDGIQSASNVTLQAVKSCETIVSKKLVTEWELQKEIDERQNYLLETRRRIGLCENTIESTMTIVEKIPVIKELTSLAPIHSSSCSLTEELAEQQLTDTADRLQGTFTFSKSFISPTIQTLTDMFLVPQMGDGYFNYIAINGNKMVFGQSNQLYIFTVEERKHVITHTAPAAVVDAILCPNGDILCITNDDRSILLSETGEFYKQTPFSSPRGLSMIDKEILLAANTAIYSSIDGGKNWTKIIQSLDGAQYHHAIRINFDQLSNIHTGIIWAIEEKQNAFQLVQYTLSNNDEHDTFSANDVGRVKRKVIIDEDFSITAGQSFAESILPEDDTFLAIDLEKPTENSYHVKEYTVIANENRKRRRTRSEQMRYEDMIKTIISNRSRLVFDGEQTVLLNDFNNSAIHVLSLAGEHYRGVLALSPEHGFYKPSSLALNAAKRILYVGQRQVFPQYYPIGGHTTFRAAPFIGRSGLCTFGLGVPIGGRYRYEMTITI